VFSRSRGVVSRFDRDVDALLDKVRGHPVPDRLFYALSELGDFSLLWLLIGAARGVGSARHERAAMRVFVCAAAESVLVNGIIKSFFRRQRPPWEVERPHHIRRPISSSFPSGHASAAAMHVILLSEGDPLLPVYVVVGVLVATSRVYVKIHHASDVLGGLGLGVGLGILARRLIPLNPPGGDAGR
jgi:undecaprenyl-diphosphatase